MHDGTPGTSATDSAYSLGVMPTISWKRALKDPRLWKPTSRHTSVTDRSPARSSAFARSTRRVSRWR
jgi:hypothetical protein